MKNIKNSIWHIASIILSSLVFYSLYIDIFHIDNMNIKIIVKSIICILIIFSLNAFIKFKYLTSIVNFIILFLSKHIWWLTPVLAPIVIFIELFILKNIHTDHLFLTWSIIFIYLSVYFIFQVFAKGRQPDFLLAFVSSMHNHAKSFGGIIIILFVLIQIHIIGTEAHNYIHDESSFIAILVCMCGLLFPFTLHSLIIEYSPEKKFDKSVVEILVTSISFNKVDVMKKYLDELNVKDKTIIDILRDRFNYKALLFSLKDYKNIKKILLISDLPALAELENFKKTYNTDFLEVIVTSYCIELGRSVPSLEYLKISDINDFDKMYSELKPEIEGRINDLSGEKIVFNISPGTGVITSTLSFLSVLGNRRFCYLSQNDSDPEPIKEFRIGAYDLKDIWGEFLTLNEKKTGIKFDH